ncbi:hypothetical protein [Natrinema sp. CBA1119]|uniref:hypothetical protein n=1 Tax=Natrinema sp. CBA1119 TaxID=1608465 RepID=UPI0020D270C3|nr:hypothetical protein [Natrinema sp. CBA1119]
MVCRNRQSAPRVPRLIITVLGLVFNYGTTVTTAADAAVFDGVSVGSGYLVFTVRSLLSNRFWWEP